jgi:hypothetical protein
MVNMNSKKKIQAFMIVLFMRYTKTLKIMDFTQQVKIRKYYTLIMMEIQSWLLKVMKVLSILWAKLYRNNLLVVHGMVLHEFGILGLENVLKCWTVINTQFLFLLFQMESL